MSDGAGSPGDPRREAVAPIGHVEKVLRVLGRTDYVTDGWTRLDSHGDRVTLSLATRTGVPVVAKLYPSGEGEAAYVNMQELWRSSFGERCRPPGLLRPIDYLPDIGVLVMERVEGRPLAGLDLSNRALVEGATRLVASLHRCDARPSTRRDWTRVVRSVARKADRVAGIMPQFADVFREVAEALGSTRPEDQELAPCHGDFSPQNVLVAADRVTLIDWDRFQLADPARDIAYMGAWGWVWRLRQGRPADWSMLELVVGAYDSLRARASVRARVGVHVAAGLMRIAHDLVMLRPEDRHLVPELAAEALRHLRRHLR